MKMVIMRYFTCLLNHGLKLDFKHVIFIVWFNIEGHWCGNKYLLNFNGYISWLQSKFIKKNSNVLLFYDKFPDLISNPNQADDASGVGVY